MPLAIVAAGLALLIVFGAGVLVGRRRERRQIEDRLFGLKVRLR